MPENPISTKSENEQALEKRIEILEKQILRLNSHLDSEISRRLIVLLSLQDINKNHDKSDSEK